jgi:hypothetical protein
MSKYEQRPNKAANTNHQDPIIVEETVEEECMKYAAYPNTTLEFLGI